MGSHCEPQHATTAATSRTFAIDKTHSDLTFQVRHLVTKVRGRFTDFSGTVPFDEARPELSSASFEAAPPASTPAPPIATRTCAPTISSTSKSSRR